MNIPEPDKQTLSYYDQHARQFVTDTVNASMSEALLRFVDLLPEGARVLDWGCGSGRDTKWLLDAGYAVTAIDASPAMCQAAAQLTGITPRCQGFLQLNEEPAFDGIWACASLLHLKRAELPVAFDLARKALVPGGVLYASFKYGTFEGYRNGRWFTDLTESDISNLLQQGWSNPVVWQSADVRPGRGGEQWLNFLARRIS